MRLLAIDTATEQCSVAITSEERTWSRVTPTARDHADLILPMIDDVLQQSGLNWSELQCLAFGRGPGSFTGVRIAVSVIQGLALAKSLPVVGISNLAAVAQRAVSENKIATNSQLLVCMDARMKEVYWSRFRVDESGFVTGIGEEFVSSPDQVELPPRTLSFGAGTGWRAFPELRLRDPSLSIDDSLLPRAIEIAQLARVEFAGGRFTSAANAQPVYLRDRVVAI